jgi:hypothetical protein
MSDFADSGFDASGLTNPKRVIAKREAMADNPLTKPQSATEEGDKTGQSGIQFLKGKRPKNPQKLAEMLRKHGRD